MSYLYFNSMITNVYYNICVTTYSAINRCSKSEVMSFNSVIRITIKQYTTYIDVFMDSMCLTSAKHVELR